MGNEAENEVNGYGKAHLIRKTFGCVRFVYNKMLAERKEVYEKHKANKEELKKQKFPTPAKYKVEYEGLKEVDSLALANAQYQKGSHAVISIGINRKK